MKKILFISTFTAIFISLVFPKPTIYAENDFEDAFKKVFLGSSIQQQQYIFAPGETIIEKENHKVYYSGLEYSGNNKVLILSLVTTSGIIQLKFPNPDIIRIRNTALKVLYFDNTKLTVQPVKYTHIQ